MIHEYLRIVCSHCGDRFDVPIYCGNRFCGVCSYARGIRIRNRIKFMIEQIRFGQGESLKHITFTIPNQSDLPKMVRHLVKSFRKLRQTDLWNKAVSGGAFVIEITGSSGDWHGHIHSVVQCRYIVWQKLKDKWLSVSGGIGVWISRIPPSAAVNYLSKYLTKPSVPDSELEQVSASLKGMRFFQPFGSWYHIDRTFPKPVKQCRDCDATGAYCLAYEMYSGDMFISKEVALQGKGPPVIIREFI